MFVQPNDENCLKKLPKFTDEVLHITRTLPESSFDNQKNIQAKTMNFHMDFEPRAQWSEVKGEITHHYLQFINAYLSERVQQVEKLKKFKNELENEIESLQSNDLSNLVWIPNIPLDELKSTEIEEITRFISLQKDIIKGKIDYFNSRVENAKTDLQEKEWQLNEINKKSSNETDNSEKDSEYDKIVKEELEILIKKFGIKDLTYAIDIITAKNKQNLVL